MLISNLTPEIDSQYLNKNCMHVTNTSPYPAARINELLPFAFRGVNDTGVEIHVKGSGTRTFAGRAYNGIPTIANVAESSRYLVVIRLARKPEILPRNIKPGVKRLLRGYPDGFPLEGWEDVFIYVAAHEARHIWQFQRTKRTDKRGLGEYDAEKFAFQRLNAWRQTTGRPTVPAIK
jgi:hypothetical protein